jgi:hypothetical protein
MSNIRLTIVAGVLAGTLVLPGTSAFADEHGKLRVPPGHLPPPGKCRIWYPRRPPGHQPAPGDCRILSRQLPRGAWLVSRERVWEYKDRPDYYYHRYRRPGLYSGKHDPRDDHRYRYGTHDEWSYSRREKVSNRVQDVRDAHKGLRNAQEQLQKNRDELKKDRAELRKDIRDKAGRKEIRQDRREIRDDARKVTEAKKDVRHSQNNLDDAHQELRKNLPRH